MSAELASFQDDDALPVPEELQGAWARSFPYVDEYWTGQLSQAAAASAADRGSDPQFGVNSNGL